IFMVKELIESGQIPRIPVYCDSPMAIKAVEIFLKHTEEYSDETRRLVSQYGSPLAWPGFTFASTSEESKKINDSRFPCIIISSSGMVTGGRIQHHQIGIPVYCDSPMAIKAVEIFLKHTEEYSDETRRLVSQYGSPLAWPGFTFASTSEESKKINDSRFPCIIISSSGMVTGGRIQHH